MNPRLPLQICSAADAAFPAGPCWPAAHFSSLAARCVKRKFPSVALAMGALAMVSLGRLGAAQPMLEVVGLTNGNVTLRLRGDVGASYRLEGSTDFARWFEVDSGVAVNGLLTFQPVNTAGAPWAFYRGVSASAAAVYPNVTPAADPNLFVEGVVTPEAGGEARLETQAAVVFTLTIPTNGVAESTAISLTLITNVTGVPAAKGFLAAVRLEPEGLPLTAPVLLQIDFPTNIPSSQIASYTFNNDGTDLHLTPDLVSSNRVRIWVTQLRSYGCGVFTLDELHALAATVPPSPPASSARTPKATLDDCYPENVRAANQLRAELTRKQAPIAQRTAAILQEARMKALLGVEEPDNPLVVGAFSGLGDWLHDELMPRMPAAQQHCRVGQELLKWILSAERQRQLLGSATGDEVDGIGAFMCALLAECQQEIEDCCNLKGGDMRLVTELLGLERQRQLMGMTDGHCGSLDVPGDLMSCVPQWFGTLRISEAGSYRTNQDTSGALSRTTETFRYDLEAGVLTVSEQIVPPIPMVGFWGYTNLIIKLGGHGLGAHVFNALYQDLWDPCGGGLRAHAPKDGGDSLKICTLFHSGLTTNLEVNVIAVLAGPVSGGFNPKTEVSILTPSFNVRESGTRVTEDRGLVGKNCEVSTTIDASSPGSDLYGGQNLQAGYGGFQFTGGRLLYQFVTNRSAGSLVITQQVSLDLRRKP